ncbi:hypothetical protein HAZT_HAZT000293 [Hyalella azteca]|uniref:3CxxC-type domain-containing protein n=1 Tax=Hyalella azteca TaxID=294128 RepID=A0A6A0H037_HYAAZ|nr:hypothetical protein HAZT_HAZT000293 [Hyalella azteca]
MTRGLENVWAKHFEILFRLLDGRWTIAPTFSRPSSGWLLFRDMAKVRFSCQICMRGWTSMFGVVLFFYRWNPEQKCGFVRFLLMGQSCSKCAKQNVFLTPMWYPEEAQRVMTNFFYKICSKVYGHTAPPMNQDRRHGRPRLQHNSGQCQGCVLGLCKPQKKLCITDKSNEEMPEAGREGHTDCSETEVQRDPCVQKAIDGVQKALAERARSAADVMKLGVPGAKCRVDGTNRALKKKL